FSSTRSPLSDVYTLSLHDALPISVARSGCRLSFRASGQRHVSAADADGGGCANPRQPDGRRGASRPLRRCCDSGEQALQYRRSRSEEHTSELQSRENLVCRLLLEK